MKQYELIYLANPGIGEEGVEELNSQISDFVRQNQGLFEGAKSEKRRLGYLVKGFSEAILVVISLSLKPESAAELQKLLKSKEDILRSMLALKLKESAPEKISGGEPEKQPSSGSESKKVAIEKIDEKIDEILHESQ